MLMGCVHERTAAATAQTLLLTLPLLTTVHAQHRTLLMLQPDPDSHPSAPASPRGFPVGWWC